jgi:hypothetical protein
MAAPPAFETHLFISYAHIDNHPLAPDQEGWISRFHASLEAMLSMRLGRQAEIWRDRKLSGNDVFADEILAQFPKTALLISVLSPRYVQSDWCTREVREFCAVAERSCGVVIENKSRVIKVIKTPVDDEGLLPPVMKDVLGYPFYIFDGEGTPLELDPAFGSEMGPKYHLKVAKLAWDISQQLRKLATTASSEPGEAVPGSRKPVIYLAECSWDQRQAREALDADLRVHGYSILPDRQLPRDEAGYVAEVARLLEQSTLSIHFVGTSYGAVPDGPTQTSVVILQNELAIARSRSADLQRVIWLPDGTQSSHPEHQRFIETLLADADAQWGADLMTCDLETLKGAVHAALQKRETSARHPSPPETDPAAAGLVYIICDERDRQAAIPLRKFLKSHQLEVQIPIFDGDAATVRQAHQDLLTQCDAVIVFYGAGDESWKRTIDSDLRKMKGYGRHKPLRGSYTYLAAPATDDKRDLIAMEEPDLVDGLEGFVETAMQPLLETLKRSIT